MPFANTSFVKSSSLVLLFCSFILTYHCQTVFGQLEFLSGGPTYKSTAVIQIQPNEPLPSLAGAEDTNANELPAFIRHDKLIASQLIVETCFNANALFQLPSFEHMTEDEVIENVLSNLEIEWESDTPTIFKLKFTSLEPADARVVLANLILTYENYMEKESEKQHKAYIDFLLDVRTKHQNQALELDHKISDLKSEIEGEAGISADFEILTQAISTKRDLLFQKEMRQKIISNCIASQPEKQISQNMIWNLVQWGEIKESNLVDQDPLGVLNKTVKKIDIEIAWVKEEIKRDMAVHDKLIKLMNKHQMVNAKILSQQKTLSHIVEQFHAINYRLFELQTQSDSQSHAFTLTSLQNATFGKK